MHEPDKHAPAIKNWKQLAVVVVLAFAVPIVVIILLSQYITGTPKGAGEGDSAVLNRIKPVGDVLLALPGAPKGQMSGEQVYNQVCKTCHESGLAGAPKTGDKAAWAKVIAQGLAPTVDHAVKGIRAMPAKGGNPDFENVEVERAVVFMANKSGGNWKEPPAPVPASPAPTVTAAAPAPAAPPATPSAGGKADGKKVYVATCAVCHAAGIAGAPKFGDKPAWAPRLKPGIDALYANSIKGKAAMPAKGGNASLADADVKAAVDYMVSAAK